jgi:cytochrome c553
MRIRINFAAVMTCAAGLLVTASAFGQTSADASTRQAAANLATNVCSTCHGPEGRGDNPLMPRLAGQQRAYIEVQLKAFRSQSRSDPEAHDYMWGIAATLNDNIVAGLAEYYAAQVPAIGVPAKDPRVAAEGKALFEKGSRSLLSTTRWRGDPNRETDKTQVFLRDTYNALILYLS